MPPMDDADNDAYTDEAEINNKKKTKDAKDAPGKSRRREKPPLAPVRWDDTMTETLWTLIRDTPDLKPVLINEPPRHLQPSGNGIIIFSKKDLQRRIALTLFKDSSFNLQEPAILDSLTRAVKNKLHKTQMLYDQVLNDFAPEFHDIRSERDVPRHLLQQWDKLREKFPTFLPYHLLMLEQPALIEELKQRAADINGYREWSTGPSTPNSASMRSNSNGHTRRRSLSGGPVGLADEGGPNTQEHFNFEVRPPPVGQPNAGGYSDFEQSPYSKLGASLTGSSRSPSRSPTSQSAPHMLARNERGINHRTWTSTEAAPALSGNGAASSEHIISDGGQTFASPFHHSSLELTTSNLSSIPGNMGGEFGPYQAQFASPGPITDSGSGEPSFRQYQRLMNNYNRPSLNVPSQRRSRLHTQPPNTRSLDDGNIGTSSHHRHRVGNSHERSHSGSSLTPSADTSVAPPESHLSGERSPGKWDEDSPSDESLPREGDSPPVSNALDSIIQLIKEKETRKRQREEEWTRHKRMRLDDRERQRQENEKQRLENERQRQHETKMMEMKLEIARLNAANASATATATTNAILSAQQLPIPLPNSASTIASPQSQEGPLLDGVDLEFVNDLQQLSSPAHAFEPQVLLRSGSAGSGATRSQHSHGTDTLFMHQMTSPHAHGPGLAIQMQMQAQQTPFVQSPTNIMPHIPLDPTSQQHLLHSQLQHPQPQSQQPQPQPTQQQAPVQGQMLSPEQQAYVSLYPAYGF